MLRSSDSPRHMIVTLRAWEEKNSAACPAELPAPTMWTSRPWVAGASLRAAPYAMPLPASRSKPSRSSCRQATPGEDDRPRPQDVAAVEVQLAVDRVDALDRARDEDLGAEPARLLERAARELVARHARREAEVVLDPRGLPACPPGASRSTTSVRSPSEAPYTAAASPAGPLPRSPCRTRRRRPRCPGRAARPHAHPRPHDGLAVEILIAGRSASAGSGPPQRWSASGTSGVTQANRTWLRSRKRRSSEQDASQRWPTTSARGDGGAAARPWSPRRPDILCAASCPTCCAMSGTVAAIAW